MIFKILLFMGLVIGQISSQGDLFSEWKSFKTSYGKTYASPMEEMRRMTLFAANLQAITEFNSKPFNTYTQGINAFSDYTPAEMQSMINTGIGPPTNLTKSMGLILESPVFTKQAPAEKDWTKSGCVTKVKNQGQCGSCWAFAAVGALESMQCIKKKVSSLIALSEQHLVDCYKKDCNGQYVWEANNYIKNNGGLSSEKCYPYKSGSDGKAKACADRKDCYSGKITGNQMVKNENDLIKAVGTIGPVSVQICVPQVWCRYKGGIFNDDAACKSSECNNAQHAVLAVGYGTENGNPYWIVKNSWGEGWGEKGYIRMKRGTNICSIGSWACYPIV